MARWQPRTPKESLQASLERLKERIQGKKQEIKELETQVAQVDQAIKSGKKAEIDALTVPGELVKFTRGVVGTQPEIWQTTVLRTEQLDANRLAADVTINARELGKDRAGTAVLILVRVAGSWKLGGIEFFEVR